jgi:plasmid stabilization system protein ParE
MAYKVRLTALAEADAYTAFERIRVASPAHAERWLTGLFRAVLSLDEMPTRCPLIPEAEEIGQDIRQLLYGKRSGMQRIIFDMQEQSEEGPRVRILRIWHGSRDRLRAEDIESEETGGPK